MFITSIEEAPVVQELGGELRRVNELLKMVEFNLVVGIFKKGERLKRHLHKEPITEIYFVIKGTGLVLCDNKEIRIKEGDLLKIEPNEVHSIKNDGEELLKILFLLVPHPDSADTVLLEE